MSYRETIYIFRKTMKRGLCRLSNFENLSTTGRAIVMLMTEIKIEKRYGARILALTFMFLLRIGDLVVSVSACRLVDPSSSLTLCTIFGSTSVNHETFRDIGSACREGGIGAAVGESRTIPRYVSCCQSRTFPMYIAF